MGGRVHDLGQIHITQIKREFPHIRGLQKQQIPDQIPQTVRVARRDIKQPCHLVRHLPR